MPGTPIPEGPGLKFSEGFSSKSPASKSLTLVEPCEAFQRFFVFFFFKCLFSDLPKGLENPPRVGIKGSVCGFSA